MSCLIMLRLGHSLGRKDHVIFQRKSGIKRRHSDTRVTEVFGQEKTHHAAPAGSQWEDGPLTSLGNWNILEPPGFVDEVTEFFHLFGIDKLARCMALTQGTLNIMKLPFLLTNVHDTDERP